MVRARVPVPDRQTRHGVGRVQQLPCSGSWLSCGSHQAPREPVVWPGVAHGLQGGTEEPVQLGSMRPSTWRSSCRRPPRRPNRYKAFPGCAGRRPVPARGPACRSPGPVPGPASKTHPAGRASTAAGSKFTLCNGGVNGASAAGPVQGRAAPLRDELLRQRAMSAL